MALALARLSERLHAGRPYESIAKHCRKQKTLPKRLAIVQISEYIPCHFAKAL